jgi:hypothetical protein
VADTTRLDDYPPDSPEAAEWRQVRERNVGAFRRRALFDRFGNTRRSRFDGLDVGAAEQVSRRVGQYADEVEAMSAAGVLLFPDTSEHQGAFNLQWCRDAGFKVHAYKATEGRTYVDSQQARTRDEIRRLGLIGMVYGFVYWSKEYDANPSLWNEQGRFFAQHAPAEFAHAIDVEMLCTGKSTDVDKVVAGYRSVYPDHPLIIYTNRGLYSTRSRAVPDPSSLGLLLWHAGIGNGYYTSATGSLPSEWSAITSLSNSMSGFGPEVIWQFTDHGAAAGQSVDGNAYKGTVDSFRRVFITGGDEDMPLTNADADLVIDRLLNRKVTSAWHGTDLSLLALWLSTHRYAVEAGYPGTRPAGNPAPNTPTLAKLLMAASGDEPTLAEINQGFTTAFKAQVPGMSQAVVDGIRSALPTDVTIDPEQIHGIVAAALDEHLGTLKIVSDASQAGEG